ncbi:GTPase, G3E family [Propionibacterium cyclohexanicum]|uniref:GTPase, G3E family n=1 Tax=Propionibacterium cyclohexanicum TaxID=64702 RepID=A0A1H9SPC0_9ACTN|nr:GTP-binding protein [Propionibacterium cyclohexanicum]SER86243.1 GTPase, G3E family [Propionibacterium cyclohexanicum]
MRDDESGGRATKVVLVSGLTETSMATTTTVMQWYVPGLAVVRHHFDPRRETLTRTVCDEHEVLERVELDMTDACLDCTVRADLIATLERLSTQHTYEAVIAQLPATVEAMQVCRALHANPGRAPHVRLAASVVALEGSTACDDLVGPDYLDERELPVREDDLRGVAETASAMVECADAVVCPDAGSRERALIRTLGRPGIALAGSVGELDLAGLLAGVHDHRSCEQWNAVVRRGPLPRHHHAQPWVLDLASARPFHPDRLHAAIRVLGAGARRARGCFWLPSRPTQTCQWDGAGGQLSIGQAGSWGNTRPLTRIVVVGIDEGRDELEEAFRACLLTDDEIAERGQYWERCDDGFTPWLGPLGAGRAG